MNESGATGMNRRATVALLLAVFAAAVGYGVVLPVLPLLLESFLPSASFSSIGWHSGALTAIYAGAPLLFAPLWGRWSDRRGRRSILLLGVVGFGATLAVTAFAPSIGWLYTARFLNGAFAAAILPTAQAFVADRAVSDGWRAERFAWLGMASIAGFFVGPMLGGIVLQWGSSVSSNTSTAQLIALPFLISAGLALLGAVGLITLEGGSESPAQPSDKNETVRRRAATLQLLFLAGLVAAGVAAFEVVLALRGRSPGMTPYQVGIMFAECSMVMFAVQGLVFSPLVAPSSTAKLITPTLVIMATGLFLVPYAETFAAQLVVIGSVAAGAGVLTPTLTYWTSLVSGGAQGAELGRQAAAASLGQTVGSAAGGVLYAAGTAPEMGFLLLGGLILAAAAASLRLGPRLLAAGIDANGTAAATSGSGSH
ncbi:MAG: MFS transporter [Mesorhizobium sp.]|nr:MAG: MFS transporter [Mesorhizobium sp.]